MDLGGLESPSIVQTVYGKFLFFAFSNNQFNAFLIDYNGGVRNSWTFTINDPNYGIIEFSNGTAIIISKEGELAWNILPFQLETPILYGKKIFKLFI